MSALCAVPILTGETGGEQSWEPCGRALHGATGMCVHHARDAGLIARSVLSLALREKMADGRRKRRSSGDPDAAAKKKAQASATFAEVRRLRKEATERRRMREAAVDKRMNKPRGVRPSD